MNSGPSRGNVVPLRPPEVFRPFFPSTMTGLPPKPPEWLVDSLLLRGSVCLLTGTPGIGKSLALQQLLTAVALGKPWLDKETLQVRTFGLFGEDPQDQLERRQLDINAHYDAAPPDYEDNYAWDSRDALDAVMWGRDARGNLGPTPFWDSFWDFVAEHGSQLVMLDTTAVVYDGNENIRSEVTPFMRALTRKAAEGNLAIILASHPARGTPHGYSGSTAWLGSSRFAFNLGRPKDFDPETGQPALERVIRGLKFNYSAGIAAEKILWNRGVFIPDRTGEPPAPKTALNRIDRMDLQYRLLEGMRRAISLGAKLSADELSSTSMPSRARRSPDPMINRLPLNDLYKAQQELIDSGMAVLVSVESRVLIRPASGPAYSGEQPWDMR